MLKPALLTLVSAALCWPAAASAAWLPPADVAPATTADVGEPSLAVARDGTAFAAFLRSDGAKARAVVAMRAPGGGFGAPQELSPAGDEAANPVVAVDDAGNATLAWFDVTANAIQTRLRPAGGDWGPVTTLQPAGLVFDGPSLAVAGNGATAIAWGRATAGPRVQVRVAVRPAGGQAFGAALPASPDAGTGICGIPRVAIDDAADVAALWTRRTSDAGDYHVESAVKPAAAPAFAPSEPRSATTGDSPCNTGIAMAPDGRVTAMWDFAPTTTEPPYVAYADRSTPFATGAWSPQAKLSVPADPSRHPTFTLDDAGSTLVTWLDNGILQSAVRAGLGPFTAQRPLSGSGDQNGQAMAASPNGDALAAFVGMSNGNDAIFASRRTAGGAFADPLAVATTPAGGNPVFFDSPALGLDDQGNGFAVWRRAPLNGASTVQLALFDPVPPSITAADVPATATTGVPVGMTAAAGDRMSGAALHFGFGDGSGADGPAVGHIYAAPGTYGVTITATDGAGNASAVTRPIVVSDPPPPPPPPPGRLLTVTSLSWDRLPNGGTRLKKLVVEGLQGPETVRLSCQGKGCRKSAHGTFRKHGRRLVLTKRIKGMVLRPKARLAIATTRTGYIPRTITYTMVRHRDPKKSTRCLPPGAKKAKAC